MPQVILFSALPLVAASQSGAPVASTRRDAAPQRGGHAL